MCFGRSSNMFQHQVLDPAQLLKALPLYAVDKSIQKHQWRGNSSSVGGNRANDHALDKIGSKKGTLTDMCKLHWL